MRFPLALLALAVVAAPGPAVAAPWTAPVAITAPDRSATDALPLTSGNGGTLVFYRAEGGGVPGGECSFTLRQPRATSFGTRRFKPESCAGAVTYGQRSFAQMTQATTRRGERFTVSLGSVNGGWAAFRHSQTVIEGRNVLRPVLAGNAAGFLAVAWFENRGTSNDRVWLRLRRRSGRFGAPILIAQGVVRNVTVAVGVRGDVLVAWDARGTVKARLRGAREHSFGRTETIRSEDAYFAALSATITSNGRAVLGWSAQFLSEGGDRGPKFHQVAVRPAGARRFRAAQLLERDDRGSVDIGNLQLVGGPGDQPFAAWTGHDGDRAVVRVSESDARGVFGAPQTVSTPGEDAYVTSAARAPGGLIAVAWMRDFDTPSQVFAAYRPSTTAPFGPPEQVSQGENARKARLTFGPDGRLTAVWEDVSGVGDDRVLRIFAAERTG